MIVVVIMYSEIIIRRIYKITAYRKVRQKKKKKDVEIFRDKSFFQIYTKYAI